MTTTYDIPTILRPLVPEFDLRGMTLQGPVTLAQNRQVLDSQGGYWIATYRDVAVVGRDKVLAHRMLRGQLRGGANWCRVPVCDGANAPWPTNDDLSILSTFDDTALFGDDAEFRNDQPPAYLTGRRSLTSTFSDTALFSDGSSFRDAVINVTVAVAGTAGDTSIEVTKTMIANVVGGEYFSIDDHLHQIVQEIGDGVWQIVPALREDVAAGAQLEFDRPVCVMVLASEQEMDAALERNKSGVVSIAFFEAFEAE